MPYIPDTLCRCLRTARRAFRAIFFSARRVAFVEEGELVASIAMMAFEGLLFVCLFEV
jgi:hypothetical protein